MRRDLWWRVFRARRCGAAVAVAMTCKLNFCDTETTGKNPVGGAEIIEYAVVQWIDGDSKTILHEYVMPKRPENIEPAAQAVNGFTVEAWAARKADTWQLEDCRMLTTALTGDMIAGSNPDFDKCMIAAECRRMGQPDIPWSHRTLNTASLGMPLWLLGVVESTGLGPLGEYFGLAAQEHTALADCYRAIHVWESLFDLYVHKPRVMREGLLEIAADPATDQVLRDYCAQLARGEA